MNGDCASLLRAGRHHAARVLRHSHRPVGHAGVHARGMPAARPPAAGCRDTDAPYHALHSSSGPASGVPGRGLGSTLPASSGPASGAAGRSLASTAAKAAGLLAASSAAGAAAGSSYRALATAQADLQSQAAIEPLSAPAFGLALGPPPLAVPGISSPISFPSTESITVAEPSSALVLLAGLLSVVLMRYAARRRTSRQLPPAIGQQPSPVTRRR